MHIEIDIGLYRYIQDMNPILTFPKLKDFNKLTENQLNFPRTHIFVFSKQLGTLLKVIQHSFLSQIFLIALNNPVIPLLPLQPLCGNEKYSGEVLTIFLMG